MTNSEFRYWLQGFFFLSNDEIILDTKQLHVIRNHLNLAEAVEGKLDQLNTHLRNRISETIDNEHDENTCSLLTEELKDHLQSILK